jgi:calmodulin
MADLLSVEQIAELKEAFSVFDRDGDGTITVQDLTDVFKTMGQSISPQGAKRMVEEADMDQNGVVDFPEFLTMVANRMFDEDNTGSDLRDTFDHYDLAHTGYITASNLQHIMARMGCRLTAEEADEMLREGDVDGDGKIGFDDFRRLMSTGR